MSEILFLAHRVPFPPNRGDKIRSCHLLKKLAQLAPVHVGCFAETDEDRAGGRDVEALAVSSYVVNRNKPLVLAGVEAVLSGKPVSLTAFHSAKLEAWVRQTVRSRAISTIFVFSGQMGQYIPDDYGGQVIVDLCDVDSAKFENYAQTGQRVWLNAREGRLLAKEEARIAKRADATVLISENEGMLLRSRLPESSKPKVQVIGNGIDASFFDPASVQKHPDVASRPGPHFVFTGQMDYPPNEQAALWAMSTLWPALRRDHPAAELHIVGRNPANKLTEQAGEGITVWGEVPDVRPFIAAADCVVVPLTIARGVQNKVLEAMAMARPLLLTSEAATGIDAEHGVHWTLCKAEAHEMSEAVLALLSDPQKAEDLGRAARQFVLDHHDWDAMLAPLDELVDLSLTGVRHAA